MAIGQNLFWYIFSGEMFEFTGDRIVEYRDSCFAVADKDNGGDFQAGKRGSAGRERANLFTIALVRLFLI